MSNQNTDRPDRAIAGLLRDLFLFFKETFFEFGKQQDSITVWLVGMSTGSIALIISQAGKLNFALSVLRWSVGFLAGTIVLGLLFRVFHLFLQESRRSDLQFIVAWLSVYSQDSTEPPIELREEDAAGFIASCLYNHMGVYLEPEVLREIEAENDVEYWRNRYEEHTASYYRSVELKNQTIRLMLDELHAVMADLEGISLQKFKQTLERGKSDRIKKRCLKYVCTASYILMCVSFAISILFISWSFITTDWQVRLPSATTNQKVVSPSEPVQPTQTNKSE